MADAEHLRILKRGVDAWNQWRQANPKVAPDLTGVDLTTKDNSGACWDETKNKANLAAANLQGVRFHGSTLTSVILRKADLREADFTEVILNDADCRGVKAVKTKFNLVEAIGANFRGAILDEAVFIDANWSNASFVGASLKGTLLKGNFSGADLRECDQFFVPWTTGLTGAPKVPLNYPTETPVESIIGLNAHTRRMVADGLYVNALWERSGGLNRLGLRMWGVTCGYGQSLMRWIVLSLGFVLLASAVETQLNMNFANHHSTLVKSESGLASQSVSQIDKPSFEQALYHSIVTFATLGFGDVTPTTLVGRVWVIVVVCAGYIMLGGLVSIFASKLGRLA